MGRLRLNRRLATRAVQCRPSAPPAGLPRMRLNPLRLLALVLPFVALAGCGTTGTTSCGSSTDYLAAVERPRLQLPPEIEPTERLQPLAIPSIDPNPTALDPVPECLDQPPRYFARKGSVADPAAEAARAWAAAWAARKPDAVIAAYSTRHQASGEGPSTEFLDQRRKQVETGRPPEPGLEDVNVSTVGADRKVVTFVQRFGEGAVRKELTMVREEGNWRIISERTLEVL